MKSLIWFRLYKRRMTPASIWSACVKFSRYAAEKVTMTPVASSHLAFQVGNQVAEFCASCTTVNNACARATALLTSSMSWASCDLYEPCHDPFGYVRLATFTILISAVIGRFFSVKLPSVWSGCPTWKF